MREILQRLPPRLVGYSGVAVCGDGVLRAGCGGGRAGELGGGECGGGESGEEFGGGGDGIGGGKLGERS